MYVTLADAACAHTLEAGENFGKAFRTFARACYPRQTWTAPNDNCWLPLQSPSFPRLPVLPPKKKQRRPKKGPRGTIKSGRRRNWEFVGTIVEDLNLESHLGYAGHLLQGLADNLGGLHGVALVGQPYLRDRRRVSATKGRVH